MANEQVLQDRISLCEVRLDHPQDVMEEITDLFYQSADAVSRLRERIALGRSDRESFRGGRTKRPI